MCRMNKIKTGVFLGFDFGTKRIGVALGQEVTGCARPLVTLPAKKGVICADVVHKLVSEWGPEALVVGIPLNMDGTQQPVTQAARCFADWLATITKLPVFEMDERLSTRSAREQIFARGGFRALKNTEVDSHAAQIILQNWLDAHRGGLVAS